MPSLYGISLQQATAMATDAAASGIQEPTNDIGSSLAADDLAMPSIYKPEVGEAIKNPTWMREDEWEIDFEDTHGFAAERWATANRIYGLGRVDLSLVENVTNHNAFKTYLRQASDNEKDFQLTGLQSVWQIYRPLRQFESLIKMYVERDDISVDTSGLWAMVYLNIKLSMESAGKLKHTAWWLTDIQRKINLFNRCIQQCRDRNSIRIEMSEIFSPLFGVLFEPIMYLQGYNADEEYSRHWSFGIDAKIREHLNSIEETIKHIHIIGRTDDMRAEELMLIPNERRVPQLLERFSWRSDLENESNSATRRQDIPPMVATPTKPLPLAPLTPQTLNKDLPISIKGQMLNASADTGSDDCGMPKDVADHLGLKVRCAPRYIKEFEIGNGRKIKSIGRTTVDCSFWNEPSKKLRCVFYVFERLVVPLIMGRDFLERTDTLTQHQDRLVDRAPRMGPCRVMHLSRPKRRMRCYIDSDLVEANPDTGAEMELVSPDFIKRKGYTTDAPDVAHEEVQFADGSTARTQGKVTIKFEAYGNAFQEAVPSKARYRTFYVLDGLTTDILLGEDLLYSINAFTEHTSSFVDLDGFGMPVELKGIFWLDRAEQRLARIFGGDLPGSPATSASGSTGIDTQSRMQRFTSLIGRATGARTRNEAIRTARRELDFERDMDNRDARENARQEAADLRIDRLPPPQRATAEEQEERVRQAFDDDQRQRRQQHEAALAAAVRHVPMQHSQHAGLVGPG